MTIKKTLLGKLFFVTLVVALVIAADQISKNLVLQSLQPGQLVPIVPNFFNLTLTYNPGAAFGLWTSLTGWYRILAIVFSTAVALCAVLYFLRHKQYARAWPQVALALILGGALGNIIDRVQHGAVVDFLDFYLDSYHWPAFNVADSAICVGVFALIFYKPPKTEGTA